MNRREVFTLAAASAVATTGTVVAAEPNNTKVIVQAPFDVFIVQVVAEGAVTKGQKLFELKSFELEHFTLHLELFEQHLAILERPFHDGRMEQREKFENANFETTKNAHEQAQVIFKHYDDLGPSHDDGQGGLIGLGQLGPSDIAQQRIILDESYMKLLHVELEHRLFGRNKQDILDKLTLGRQKLMQQRALLDEMKSKLTILAPKEGRFSPQSGVGLFSKRGHILGEIS